MIYLMVFVLSLFPRDVLDEIWDLTESVSKGFPNYFLKVIEKFCKVTGVDRLSIDLIT